MAILSYRMSSRRAWVHSEILSTKHIHTKFWWRLRNWASQPALSSIPDFWLLAELITLIVL